MNSKRSLWWVMISFILLFPSVVFSQMCPATGKVTVRRASEKTRNDSIPELEFIAPESGTSIALYLNGKYIPGLVMKSINPKRIAQIQVEKARVREGAHEYYGQLFLQLKEGYHPSLISLVDLKKKYVPKSSPSAIFFVDDELIGGDYSQRVVDEKYIQMITVSKLDDRSNKQAVDVIRLTTRGEENVRIAHELRIRDDE